MLPNSLILDINNYIYTYMIHHAPVLFLGPLHNNEAQIPCISNLKARLLPVVDFMMKSGKLQLPEGWPSDFP